MDGLGKGLQDGRTTMTMNVIAGAYDAVWQASSRDGLMRPDTRSATAAAKPFSEAGAPDGTLARVIQTFERVLQHVPVAADDDFFDLGGDSIMAVALTLELEEATGLRLPITALFDASTPAALSELLGEARDHDVRTAPSAIVRLRPGPTNVPGLFVAAGAGGSAIALLPMAKLIDADCPVYGLQSPGVDGRETPLDRIVNMAEYFLPRIRAVQPHGPYLLAGYSMGGLTAIEIARLLIEAGEAVSLVALLDTSLPRSNLPAIVRLRIFARRASFHAARLYELPPREAIPYLRARLYASMRHLGFGSRARRRGGHAESAADPQAVQNLLDDRRVLERGVVAVLGYRQRYLRAPITFIQAASTERILPHADLVWNGMTPRLRVREVGGDHSTMLGLYSGHVAACLSACVREATAASETTMRHVGRFDAGRGRRS